MPPSPPPVLPRRPGRSRARGVAFVILVSLCLSVLTPLPAARGDGGRWQWPSPAPHQVVGAFEAPDHRYGPGHRGLDIAVAGGAGAPVRAVEAGTVRFAGQVAGRGVVSVRHEDGLLSTYEPVTASVEAGQAVSAGDGLGVVAQVAPSLSHCPGQVCLHLGARRGEAYLDPLLLLGARGPAVLLPWTGTAGRPVGAVGAAGVAGTGEGARSGPVAVHGDPPTPVRAGGRVASIA